MIRLIPARSGSDSGFLHCCFDLVTPKPSLFCPARGTFHEFRGPKALPRQWCKSRFLSRIVEVLRSFVRRMRAWRWGRPSNAKSKRTSGLHIRSCRLRRVILSSTSERAVRSGAVRPVCRRAMREVLHASMWTVVADPRNLLPVAAD